MGENKLFQLVTSLFSQTPNHTTTLPLQLNHRKWQEIDAVKFLTPVTERAMGLS